MSHPSCDLRDSASYQPFLRLVILMSFMVGFSVLVGFAGVCNLLIFLLCLVSLSWLALPACVIY